MQKNECAKIEWTVIFSVDIVLKYNDVNEFECLMDITRF